MNNALPQVSVIIIFLNGEPYLHAAIESVLAQSFTDWELLLVDDGSSDRSTMLARQYATLQPARIRYLEHAGHQNRGMSASRNLGVRHARGRSIAFLDADDLWLPHMLQRQVVALEAQPAAAMVYGPIQLWYSWTGAPEDAGRDTLQQLHVPADTLIAPPTVLLTFLRQEGSTPSGLLIRYEVFERAGWFEEAFRGMYEDQVFCAKICLNEQVYVMRDWGYRYRQHSNSHCAEAVGANKHMAARLIFLQWLDEYVARQPNTSRQVRQAIRSELWKCHHPLAHHVKQKAKQLWARISK